MDVPKNYHFIRHQITWEKEDYYIYKDSAYIYISDFDISPNYNNIANLGDSILSYRFQNKELYREVNNLLGEDRFKIVSDTLELYGINVNGLFWKDIKIGNISIGYNNVSEEEKVIYDKAINTFKKNNTCINYANIINTFKRYRVYGRQHDIVHIRCHRQEAKGGIPEGGHAGYPAYRLLRQPYL